MHRSRESARGRRRETRTTGVQLVSVAAATLAKKTRLEKSMLETPRWLSNIARNATGELESETTPTRRGSRLRRDFES